MLQELEVEEAIERAVKNETTMKRLVMMLHFVTAKKKNNHNELNFLLKKTTNQS